MGGSRGSHRTAWRAGGIGGTGGTGGTPPLSRLLPRVLVVTVLVCGTAAFASRDKTVILTVDGGPPRTVHTFAGDVAGVLTREDIRPGPYDVVTPGLPATVSDGDAIVVRRHARPPTGASPVNRSTRRTTVGSSREHH